MSYDAEIENLKKYNEWVMEQKLKGVDVSPEAYMLDVAKEQALEKLIKIASPMEEFYETPWETPEDYEAASTTLHDEISTVLHDL